MKALFSANERRCNAKPFLEKLRQEIGAITTIDSEEKKAMMSDVEDKTLACLLLHHLMIVEY